jgi:4-hydroxy-3-methylbut-2-enyl diphosphate reductase
MAIKALTWLVRVFEPPVYCFHEIVHNRLVVERFERLGVRFVNDIDEVPAGAPLMLSAHGSAPEVVIQARDRAGVAINAVCPLVTKVHHEVKTRANQGYSVIYVGHAGHDEAVGTMAVAPDHVYLVEKPADVDALTDVDPSAVALLAQTTLAIDDWADVRVRVNERFPDAWMPGRSDLCFATTNRQAALLQLCDQVDSVVIIGSENSSNTMALVRMAQARCAGRVVRVNDVEELPAGLTGTVGVTAGASAPEDVVQAVIARLAPRQGFQIVDAIDEDEYFPPPRELRGLFADLTAIARVAFDIPDAVSPLSDDRQRDAAHALG